MPQPTIVTGRVDAVGAPGSSVGWWRWWWTGPVLGLAIGVVARGWMRWISVEPEFTWAGTTAIVVAFVLFFTAQATAQHARVRARSRRRVAAVRAAAGVLSLGLFGAAGAVMFPTVLFGSLASWRSGLHRVARCLLAIAALPTAVLVVSTIVDDHGWSAATSGRILVFAAIYAAVIAGTRPTVEAVDGGWVASRRAIALIVLVMGSLIGAAVYFGGIE